MASDIELTMNINIKCYSEGSTCFISMGNEHESYTVFDTDDVPNAVKDFMHKYISDRQEHFEILGGCKV